MVGAKYLESRPWIGKLIFGTVLLAMLAVLYILVSRTVHYAVDWEQYIYPAGQRFFQGKNPYLTPGFYNPPWLFVILAPLFLIPVELSRTLAIMLSLVGFGFAAYRLGAKPLALLAVLLTEPVVNGALFGNFDYLIALGMLLPARYGLFLVLIKPQSGIGIVIFWLWEAWKRGGIREVFRTFWPVTLAFLVSFLFFGLYPLQSAETITMWWNSSLFPYSIPLGIGLIYYAIKTQRIHTSAAAGVFLSPYVSRISYSMTALAFVHSTRLTVLICLVNWAAFLGPILYSQFFSR